MVSVHHSIPFCLGCLHEKPLLHLVSRPGSHSSFCVQLAISMRYLNATAISWWSSMRTGPSFLFAKCSLLVEAFVSLGAILNSVHRLRLTFLLLESRTLLSWTGFFLEQPSLEDKFCFFFLGLPRKFFSRCGTSARMYGCRVLSSGCCSEPLE